MSQLSTVMKSMSLVTIIGIYMFSGSSLAAGTCAIGYVDVISLTNTADEGPSGGYTVRFSVDSTGFVSPTVSSYYNFPPELGGQRYTMVWANDGGVASTAQLTQLINLLKLSLSARIPVRFWTTDSNCEGPQKEFEASMCVNDTDCNHQ